MPGRAAPRRLALLTALALAGCGGASRAPNRRATTSHPRASEQTAAPEAPLSAGAFRPSDAVTVLTSECDERSEDDDCDGRDDDCDGHIDQGCGLAAGDLQITVAWSTGADIDLYVIEPAGDTLSFQRRRSTTGGRVDAVGRGRCGDGEIHPRVENLVWEGAEVLRGTYRVMLHYWGECQSAAGPTEVVASMALGGRVLGTVGYVLSPNELTEVAAFDVE
jgi:tRNA (guanosine-2'-O-)-methyltransferase